MGMGESRFSRLICTTVAVVIPRKVNTFTELVSKIDHQSFVEMQLKMDWEMITRNIREVWTMIEALPPSIFWSLKHIRHWPEHHPKKTLWSFNHRLVVDSSGDFQVKMISTREVTPTPLAHVQCEQATRGTESPTERSWVFSWWVGK